MPRKRVVPTSAPKPKGETRLAVDVLREQLDAAGIPWTPEYRFAKEALDRDWRADIALIEDKTLAEVEGGTHSRGRHVRGSGYEKDCEKYNAATLLGWRVLRFTSGQVWSGYAKDTILKAAGTYEYN